MVTSARGFAAGRVSVALADFFSRAPTVRRPRSDVYSPRPLVDANDAKIVPLTNSTRPAATSGRGYNEHAAAMVGEARNAACDGACRGARAARHGRVVARVGRVLLEASGHRRARCGARRRGARGRGSLDAAPRGLRREIEHARLGRRERARSESRRVRTRHGRVRPGGHVARRFHFFTDKNARSPRHAPFDSELHDATCGS